MRTIQRTNPSITALVALWPGWIQRESSRERAWLGPSNLGVSLHYTRCGFNVPAQGVGASEGRIDAPGGLLYEVSANSRCRHDQYGWPCSTSTGWAARSQARGRHLCREKEAGPG